MTKHIDIWSILVIIVTFILFATALFAKGLTHDILLEAGIFLVSVKLIMLSYANKNQIRDLQQRLDELKTLILQNRKEK